MNRQSSNTPESVTQRRLASYAIPIGVIAVSVIVVLITLGLLAISSFQQIQTGDSLLNLNLSDQTRTFVQLQRESLRLLIAINVPPDQWEKDAVKLQYDLLSSRIIHLNEYEAEVFPPSVLTSVGEINDLWKPLTADIDALLQDPENLTLRDNIVDQLKAFEVLNNSTEIDFTRSRTLKLSDFAKSNRNIPILFAILIVSVIALLIALLYGFYRYIKEIQEAESLRQSSQFKDQFLAIMSHELRTPLNAIIGFLGIIKMGGNLPDKVLHMVDRSRANAERLLMLIDDILDISKMESGRFELHLEPVKPRELVEKWSSQMEILASQKGLAFEVVVDPALPNQLMGDTDALTKIVTNLLSNAFKFTKEGAVYLNLAKKDQSFTITVTDTGIGIPLDKQEAIFESFRQVDSSTRRSYGGTGLGLSIVKRLTQLLKGTIVVKSDVNHGSTFVVTLPLMIPTTPASVLTDPTTAQPIASKEVTNAYTQ